MQVAGKGTEIVANINLADLPPKYQAQALAKLAKQEQKKKSGDAAARPVEIRKRKDRAGRPAF